MRIHTHKYIEKHVTTFLKKKYCYMRSGHVTSFFWREKKNPLNVRYNYVLNVNFKNHINPLRRKKLEDKREPVILIGYHRNGAYRLYNHVINKIEISRDVEYEAWNWKQTVQNSNCSVNLDEKLSCTENIYDYNDSITHSSFDDQPQVVTRAHRNIQLPKIS